MEYNYNEIAVGDATGLFMLFGGIFLFFIFIGFVASLIVVISQWKIFKKAGKNGWEIIIPIYNLVVWFEITKTPYWMLLLLIIPGINIIVPILLSINTAKVFGKETSFAILLIFLPIIGYPILGFGDSKYVYNGNVSNNFDQESLSVEKKDETEELL